MAQAIQDAFGGVVQWPKVWADGKTMLPKRVASPEIEDEAGPTLGDHNDAC